MDKILCIDDDANFLIAFRLMAAGSFNVYTAENLNEGKSMLNSKGVDWILLDVMLGGENGIDAIRSLRKSYPSVNIIMISGRRDPSLIVKSIRMGAVDYLTKPFDLNDLKAIIERESENRRVKEKYVALVEEKNEFNVDSEIVYVSEKMKSLLNQAKQLKGHDANILIMGETGTGKELLAKYIHSLEDNSARPFIAVNCAAIPEHLLEAELFGSEAGAYTGSTKRRIGKFELADDGDIFLDEIGGLKLDLQAKILRVIQEHEFCRLGDTRVIKTNFRVIAASNDDLEEKVARGEFRMDLYHRIRVIQLQVPSLRDRSEDIPVLMNHYLKKFTDSSDPKEFSSNALVRLIAYQWPGNVRELANVVRSLIILSKGTIIDDTAFPSWIMNGCGLKSEDYDSRKFHFQNSKMSEDMKNYLAHAERKHISDTLKRHGGDRMRTAKALNIGRTTLYMKMKRLEIT